MTIGGGIDTEAKLSFEKVWRRGASSNYNEEQTLEDHDDVLET